MDQETKKIFATDEIAVNATAVRIPVYRSHSEAVLMRLKLS